MPLQLRRGTSAERLSIVPLPGEPILDTDLNTIFIGNGITAGGISALTGVTAEEAQDLVGQMFINGQHDGLIFTYGPAQDAANRIDVKLDFSSYDGEFVASAFRGPLFADDSSLIINSVTKAINATSLTVNNIDADSISVGSLIVNDIKGSIFGDDSTLLVNAVDSAINLDGTVKGNIIPNTNETYDIGSVGSRFRDIYLSGTSIFLGNANITATGTAINLPAGSTVGGVPIGSGGGGDGVVEGSNYKINIMGNDSSYVVDADNSLLFGSLFGNVTGDVIGDITGDVYASDGVSLVLDAGTNGTDATFTGAVNGTLTGNLFTSTITSTDSSAITIVPAVSMNSDLFVANDLAVTNDIFVNRIFASNDLNVTNDIFVNRIVSSEIISGDVSGNIITNSISSLDSSNIVFDAPVSFATRITVDDDIIVRNSSSLTLESNEPVASIQIASHYDSALPTTFTIRRSRGTTLSQTALQTDDNIASILFNAYDGTDYISGGIIQARISGTVSAGVTPTSLRFLISDTVGDTLESLRLDENGSVRIFRTLALTAPDGLSNYTNLRLTNHHSSGTDAANFALQRSRGTFDNPSTVFNGDPIYDVQFRGYDGTNYVTGAIVRAVIDGSVSSGIAPGRIDFRFQDSSGSYVGANQFNSKKSVFNTMLQLPTFADETAADASIGGAGNRVNGMMYYDTALSAVRAVVGGSWTNL